MNSTVVVGPQVADRVVGFGNAVRQARDVLSALRGGVSERCRLAAEQKLEEAVMWVQRGAVEGEGAPSPWPGQPRLRFPSDQPGGIGPLG